VEVVDTGIDTPTGGRIARLRERLADQPFVLAWCDGVADLDLGAMLDFHRSHGRAATLAAVHPRSRFGQLQLSDGEVTEFAEKPIRSEEWISGGFFALEPRALDWVKGEHDDWDREVLVRLCEAGELMAYRHESFWRCMDTPEEARSLEELWGNGAPWAVWR
jgi:glucose-1-phosphate cytidylyltransferase